MGPHLGLNIREGLRVVMAGLFVVGLDVGLGLNTGGGTGLEVGPEDEPPVIISLINYRKSILIFQTGI